MSDISNNNGAFIAAMKALLAGMATTLPANVTQVVAEGEVSSITDITNEVNGYITLYQAADDAAVVLHTAVQAREAIAPKATARYAALRNAFKSMIGKKSPNLTKVGITPDKTPAPPTLEKKKASATKGAATRTARGTKGKKQLAAIHGEVTPPTPTTPPTPATPPQTAPKTGQ